MKKTNIKIEKITLPKFNSITKEQVPVFKEEDYKKRIKNLLLLMEKNDFSHIVVYGDREHFSNINHFTGYDPRFEEALFILSKDGKSFLIVGNEGADYSELVPYDIKTILYQPFSLMGQDRSKSKGLVNILESIGINDKSLVGIIGWKYFEKDEVRDAKKRYEVPHYIVNTIINLTGEEKVKNAGDLMLHPKYGLRINLDVKELVLHEIAGTKTSEKVFNVLKNLKPGISEMKASESFKVDGEPLAVHPNVNFGSQNVLSNLASPGHNTILNNGDTVNITLGYRRAMVARTGLFVENYQEVPSEKKGIVEEFYKPYFKLLTTWYESIKIGVTGGEIYAKVKKSIGSFDKYGIGLNPGHLINTDEWTNSIFYKNSKHKINSGMAIQCDIIAFPGKPYVGTHIEDGIFVGDEKVREEIKENYPESWQRIKIRRDFMKETLGINLAEEVLPTSNYQGLLFPFLKDLQRVLVNK